MPKKNNLVIDFTHLGRKTTGLERISAELFSQDSLSEFNCKYIRSKNTSGMICQQWVGLVKSALSDKNARILCPGFPPSILITKLFGKRVVPYIHDLFLLDRVEDLNGKAKWYMRPSFKYAIENLNQFFVNSLETKKQLKNYCKASVKIVLFRPKVRNIFQLEATERTSPIEEGCLRIVMLGTVEPRKNYSAALNIVEGLNETFDGNVELHIIGRAGWGEDAERLKNSPLVKIHGYLSCNEVKSVVNSAHVYLSTSSDEGLGLPLLELQYSGIPVIATNIPIFREVLSESGYFIDTRNTATAISAINTFIINDYGNWKTEKSINNVKRWNSVAENDFLKVTKFLKEQ